MARLSPNGEFRYVTLVIYRVLYVAKNANATTSSLRIAAGEHPRARPRPRYATTRFGPLRRSFPAASRWPPSSRARLEKCAVSRALLAVLRRTTPPGDRLV